MKNKKLFLLILLSFSILLLSAGCNASATAGNNQQENGNSENMDKTLYVGKSASSIREALIIVADKEGFYEEEEVDVELVTLADSSAVLTSISLGKLDINATGITPTLTYISQGDDLVVFGGTAAEGSSVIAQPDRAEEFKDFANYANKKIGVLRMSTSSVVTLTLFQEAGLNINQDIQFIELDSATSIVESVKKGTVDVGILPNEYAEIGRVQGLEIVHVLGNLKPLYVCCRQTTSRNSLETKWEELVKFQLANLKSYKIYREDPERFIDILVDYSAQTREYVYNSIYGSGSPLTLDPNSSGVAEFYQAMVDAGYIENEYDIYAHLDTSVYEEALSRALEKNPDDPIYQELKDTFSLYNQSN